MRAVWVAFAADGRIPGWPPYEQDLPALVDFATEVSMAGAEWPIVLWAGLA
jgi:hypothetical protein